MKINLFSVPISITSKSQTLAIVTHWLRQWRRQKAIPSSFFLLPSSLSPKVIVTPNPEIIVAAQSDPEFLKALQGADLAIPDGVGIVWALKLLGCELCVMGSESGMGDEGGKKIDSSSSSRLYPQPTTHNPQLSRLSGLDLMEGMILKGYSFKDHPLKVMLVGGCPGIAQRAAEILQKGKEKGVEKLEWIEKEKENSFLSNSYLFPFQHLDLNLLSIYALSGPPDIKTASPHELNELVNSINQFSPDLLFVAFGHPLQEKWLTENRERLTVGVAMAVGGALDQIADPSLRPPPYINSIGLGWLYRLLRQPWRWRRQLALLKFAGMVVKEKLASKGLTFCG